MPIDIKRLREENKKSLEAVDNSIKRLRALLDEGPSHSVRVDLKEQFDRAQEDKVTLMSIRDHLRAAETVVAPMSAATQAKLDKLSERLDQAIRDDFVINATLAVVKKVLKAAEDVSKITSDNT